MTSRGSMSALSARVSTVPGRSVIGIELPNEKREMVSFREILSTRDYGDGTQKLPLALGKDIGGDPGGCQPCQNAPPADRRDHGFG